MSNCLIGLIHKHSNFHKHNKPWFIFWPVLAVIKPHCSSSVTLCNFLECNTHSQYFERSERTKMVEPWEGKWNELQSDFHLFIYLFCRKGWQSAVAASKAHSWMFYLASCDSGLYPEVCHFFLWPADLLSILLKDWFTHLSVVKVDPQLFPPEIENKKSCFIYFFYFSFFPHLTGHVQI